ncbi:type II toxin-antitoxin system PemK/MazF family toxin [Cohnella thermotolerans]|uniref:type II toxin-antitoxin system PemK/MazF family toxin n=1 Tax=Cohnella thermotolerans TaxID=329858 RepID=UPI003B82D72C
MIVASEVIDGDVLIIPVTSEHRRNEFDVPIKHWRHAGLVWPSIARTSKVRPVIKPQFVKKIGALHSEDLTEILEKCRTLFLLKS